MADEPTPDEAPGLAPRGGRIARWLRPLGVVFAVVCLAAVLWPALSSARELAAEVEGPRLLALTALGALAYGVLSVLLALSWWWLAGLYGSRPPFRAGYAVFARSQLAKYLPGNAFHFVSRQVLGAREGLSHPGLVASGLLEMGTLLVAALATAAVGLGRLGDAGPRIAWGWVAAVTVGCLVAWPLLDAALRRTPRTSRWMAPLPRLTLRDTVRLLVPSVALHVAFFAGTGLVLLALVDAVAPTPGDGAVGRVWTVLGAYPLAWTAGTVTVGAPAGVGVREALLTLQLGTVLTSGQAALAALALRLVTLGGDLLTGAVGWWIGSRESEDPQPQ